MGEDDQPRVLKKLTGVLGGLAGVVIAAAALKGAVQEYWGGLPMTAPSQASANDTAQAPADDAATDNASTPAPASSALPEHYSKPNGVLEKRDGDWVETDTSQGLEAHFAEVRRTADETILYDSGRDLYLKVPTKGGLVRWSHSDPMAWTDLYYVKPAEE